MKKPAVFLDRDGTINIEKNYLYKIEDWEWVPGARDAIKAFNDAGFIVVIVSNQAGIARGYYTEENLLKLNNFITEELAKMGGRIDGFYHCPHHPDFTGDCDCRKPKPGMLLRASIDLNIDLVNSWMIGDRLLDIQAAKNAGAKGIMVNTGYGNIESAQLEPGSIILDDIAKCVKYIMDE